MQEKKYIQSTVRYDGMADSREKKANEKMELGKSPL